ncbi:MAG: membrane or secreted protein [Rubripirellula sp.]
MHDLKGFATMARKGHSLLLSAALAFAVISLTGCQGYNGFCRPAGPMNQQQASAVVHDPFPQNDIGPYEAASRPPSYQQPLPEPVRNRLVPDSMPWLGR